MSARSTKARRWWRAGPVAEGIGRSRRCQCARLGRRTKLVPVMRPDDTAKVLDACKGKGFASLRDEALIPLYANTRARLSEVATCWSPA